MTKFGLTRKYQLLQEFARNAVAIADLERIQQNLMEAILRTDKSDQPARRSKPQIKSKGRGALPALVRTAFREHGQLSNAKLRELLKHRAFTSKEIINTITRLVFTGELRRVERGVYERTNKLKEAA